MKKNISNSLAISKKNVTFAVELRFLQVETRNMSTPCSLYNKGETGSERTKVSNI